MISKETFDETFSVSIVSQTCVYFLMYDKEVVYVGQTTQGLRRSLNHLDDKIFNEIGFISCKEEDLNKLETFYIAKYEPKYNKTLTNAYSIKNIKLKLKNEYEERVNVRDIKDFIYESNFEYYTFKGDLFLKPEFLERVIKHFISHEEN